MKMMGLIYNELFKQLKKPSIKIFFIIVIITGILLPVGVNIVGNISGSNNTSVNLENNQNMLGYLESDIENFEDDETDRAKIEYEYLLLDKEILELKIENEIEYDTWEDSILEYYKEARYNEIAVDTTINKYDINSIKENLLGVGPNIIDEYYKKSDSEKEEIKESFKKEAEEIKSILEEKDYNAFTEIELKKSEEKLELYKKDKIETEKIIQEGKIDDRELEEEELELEKEALENSERIIERTEENISIIRYRFENEISYEDSEWKNIAIKRIEEINSNLSIEVRDRENFEKDDPSTDYDTYVLVDNNNRNRMRSEREEILYRLENDIQPLGLSNDARSSLDSTYEIFIILSVFISIIVASGIVSSEFSKGTIRLLAIRPVSRWKILLSKLIAVIILGFVTVVLGITILFISSGVVFGFETYSIPLVETLNGVTEVSFTSYILPKILMSYASTIFIIALAFAISTIAKNTAVAVAVSMLVYLGSALITVLLVGMMGKPAIANTFIPYINSSFLRMMKIIEETLVNTFGVSARYDTGTFMLSVISVIILAVTFTYFIKKDVKN